LIEDADCLGDGRLFALNAELTVPVADGDAEGIAERSQILVAGTEQRKSAARFGERNDLFGHGEKQPSRLHPKPKKRAPMCIRRGERSQREGSWEMRER
jgi:hypothetical protein